MSLFSNASATAEFSTLSLHDALPISQSAEAAAIRSCHQWSRPGFISTAMLQRLKTMHFSTVGDLSSAARSEEHTSELQSLRHLVCRLLLEKKKSTPYTKCETKPIANR